jgi:phosphoglycerate dehydrogenase-like enzyme
MRGQETTNREGRLRILYDPAPRRTEEIFDPALFARLKATHDLVEFPGGDRDAFYAERLPLAEVLIGQGAVDGALLDRCPHLRAIFNVETNFLPNIDYDACFRRGVHVLTPSAVFALPVAELGVGLALSLARDIHGNHAAFALGTEAWGLAGNAGAELLTGAPVGMIGFGDLGRALAQALAGFRPQISVYDPWLPDGHLRRLGVIPASLDTVLADSRFLFVVASVTSENRHLLDAAALALMQPGAMLILLSRAAVVDFGALAAACGSGRIRAATDVFPEEPLPAGDPLRQVPGLLMSAHRAGALIPALREIGARVAEDLEMIARGLPPVACRRAERETVGRLRSKPIDAS